MDMSHTILAVSVLFSSNECAAIFGYAKKCHLLVESDKSNHTKEIGWWKYH